MRLMVDIRTSSHEIKPAQDQPKYTLYLTKEINNKNLNNQIIKAAILISPSVKILSTKQ